MTYSELDKLIQKRASEAAVARQRAMKLPHRKRSAALDHARRKQAAVDVACAILGANVPDTEKEERIKALFLEVL